MTIGILTSGGDCPGLNAVIRSAVFKGIQVHNRQFVGFRNGWQGVVEGDIVRRGAGTVRGISKQGGTILGTSRTNPFEGAGGADESSRTWSASASIRSSLSAARARWPRPRGSPMPESRSSAYRRRSTTTSATDYTLRLRHRRADRHRRDGPAAHDRGIPPPVHGGRGHGALRRLDRPALRDGGRRPRHPDPGAEATMEQLCTWTKAAYDRGRAPLVVVAEGFTFGTMSRAHSERGVDGFGRPRLGGIGELLAPLIEAGTGIETRATTLGHIQRGGTPTGYDRVLATRYGIAAIDAVVEERWGPWWPSRERRSATCRSAMPWDGSRPCRKPGTTRPRSSSARARYLPGEVSRGRLR